MCAPTTTILLCACDEEALEDPDWILERRDVHRAERHRRGRAMAPRFSEGELDWLARTQAALQVGCFDFDYIPADGDVLKLRWADRWYRFRYAAPSWTVDRSTTLTGWRAQMVPMTHGRLETS